MNSKHNPFKKIIEELLQDNDTVDGISCKTVHPMIEEILDGLVVDQSAMGSYLSELDHQVRDCLTTELTSSIVTGLLISQDKISDLAEMEEINPDTQITINAEDVRHIVAYAAATMMIVSNKVHERFGKTPELTERMRKVVHALRTLDEFTRSVADELPQFYGQINEALEGVEDVDPEG